MVVGESPQADDLAELAAFVVHSRASAAEQTAEEARQKEKVGAATKIAEETSKQVADAQLLELDGARQKAALAACVIPPIAPQCPIAGRDKAWG